MVLTAMLATAAATLVCLIAAQYIWLSFERGGHQVCEAPCVPGDESIMARKAHGTSATAVQNQLRWNCDGKTADRICNYNRRYAEYSGYWEHGTTFLQDERDRTTPITFYDSNTGLALFRAPVHRSWHDFVQESRQHGWPSFRDDEVVWEHVRVLPSGETVSTHGTHLGHNLPDGKGRRYCINLVPIAGKPLTTDAESKQPEL